MRKLMMKMSFSINEKAFELALEGFPLLKT